jgi:hypothetical protein
LNVWNGQNLYYAVREGEYFEVRCYDFQTSTESAVTNLTGLNDVSALKSRDGIFFIATSGPAYLLNVSIFDMNGAKVNSSKFDGSFMFLNRGGNAVYALSSGFHTPSTIVEFNSAV